MGPRGADALKKKKKKSSSSILAVRYRLVSSLVPSKLDENCKEEEKNQQKNSDNGLLFFCRQNHQLNIENACEAGRCSLTYSVCCAESPQFNYKP